VVDKPVAGSAPPDLESLLSHPRDKRKTCPICGALYGTEACDPAKHPTVAELKKRLGTVTLYDRP
jgi:hypothetical protein